MAKVTHNLITRLLIVAAFALSMGALDMTLIMVTGYPSLVYESNAYPAYILSNWGGDVLLLSTLGLWAVIISFVLILNRMARSDRLYYIASYAVCFFALSEVSLDFLKNLTLFVQIVGH